MFTQAKGIPSSRSKVQISSVKKDLRIISLKELFWLTFQTGSMKLNKD